MLTRFVPACVLSAGLVIAACDVSPTAPSALSPVAESAADNNPDAAHVATSSRMWSGYFTVTPNARRPNAPAMFLLRAEGAADSQGYALEVSKPGSSLPSVGTYRLQPGGSRDSLQVVVTHRRGGEEYQYAAHGGQLQITDASSDRVAGTFEFSGTLAATCRITEDPQGGVRDVSCTTTPGLRGPLLEVKGAFDARPQR